MKTDICEINHIKGLAAALCLNVGQQVDIKVKYPDRKHPVSNVILPN